jgi:hypothetical protein
LGSVGAVAAARVDCGDDLGAAAVGFRRTVVVVVVVVVVVASGSVFVFDAAAVAVVAIVVVIVVADGGDCGGGEASAALAAPVSVAGVAGDSLLLSRTFSGVLSGGPCGRISCDKMGRRARVGPSACSRAS